MTELIFNVLQQLSGSYNNILNNNLNDNLTTLTIFEALLACLLYTSCFQYLQAFQLICLYLWYFAYHIPWSNSLPFYHCRLAMFAVLFLPDRWKSKQFFALMGVSGAIFALGYPVFDPYTFPHIMHY